MRKRFFAVGMQGGAAPTYTISGTVYDADGTTAVASATVALGALSATSAANGTYTISNVPAGTSGSMTCTKTGYSWTAITVAAMSGNLTNQNYTNTWWAAGGNSAACVVAYKPIGAASLAASYTNLKNPGTNNAAPGTAPTWDATNGWKFASASNQYLTTGVTPAVNQTYTAVVRFSNYTTGFALFGSLKSGGLMFLMQRVGGTWRHYNGDSFAANGTDTAGVYGFSGRNVYIGGALQGNVIPAASVASALPIYIGGFNGDSSLANPISAYIQAFVIYNTTIDSAMGILSAAMANLA